MGLGIIDTLGVAGSLVFAIPLGIYGIDALLSGRTFLGGFCLAVAVAMVALPHYLTTPTDLVGGAAKRVTGKAVKAPEEDGGGNGSESGTRENGE
ncbi:hypothetical protein ACFO0N_09615 [Halobium salinum]|uniref:Uncharacterized protein n=1 Tax=Halobium salinum TaxID=1364940 RepID=A0ABD5PCL0_9EURY|nr:hypothetical protein [Halobium salinum]